MNVENMPKPSRAAILRNVRITLLAEGFQAQFEAGNIVGKFGQRSPAREQDRLISIAGALAARSQVEEQIARHGEENRPLFLRVMKAACRDLLRDQKAMRGCAARRVLREIRAGKWDTRPE